MEVSRYHSPLPRKPPINPNLFQNSHPRSNTLITGICFFVVSRETEREKREERGEKRKRVRERERREREKKKERVEKLRTERERE